MANFTMIMKDTAVLLISAEAAINLSMLAYIKGNDHIKVDVYSLLATLLPIMASCS